MTRTTNEIRARHANPSEQKLFGIDVNGIVIERSHGTYGATDEVLEAVTNVPSDPRQCHHVRHLRSAHRQQLADEITTTTSKANLRNRLAIALDTRDLDTAVSIATAVHPKIGIAKVGLQLFSAAGRDAVRTMQDIGMNVFLDVKLHDISTLYTKPAQSSDRSAFIT